MTIFETIFLLALLSYFIFIGFKCYTLLQEIRDLLKKMISENRDEGHE